MKVKNIIKQALVFLEKNDLLNTTIFDGTNTPTGDMEKEISLFVKLVNSVSSILAQEYIKLRKTNLVVSDDGKIQFSAVSPTLQINNIISVKDEYGNSVVFKIEDNVLKTLKGKLIVTYSYTPNDYLLNDTVADFSPTISERIFAYGVVAEYCFIKSLYDDYVMWEQRFKNSLQSVLSRKKEISIKKRRWL